MLIAFDLDSKPSALVDIRHRWSPPDGPQAAPRSLPRFRPAGASLSANRTEDKCLAIDGVTPCMVTPQKRHEGATVQQGVCVTTFDVPVRLETERLVVRPHEPVDHDKVAALVMNGDASKACPVDHESGSRSQILIDATSTVPW
jgi:hypothetical protein